MKTVPMLFLLFILIEQVEAGEIQSAHSLKPIKLSAEEEFKKEHKVEKQFIEKANTLGDAIKHVSGVQSSSFGPNSGAPVIRGLQGNRVGVFENGTSIQGLNAISGNVNIPFDPIFTESIKINKSSNSVRYGDQSLGGSVEVDSGLIPKEIPEKSRELDLVLKKVGIILMRKVLNYNSAIKQT
ncbi:Plug domain-containing protein [Acinetobacter faecalis]|nr:Plug domain-containing protein [Acinetobacter faecalis]MDY6524118.1 Plug domain-containing protein [Acinetobacter faecalis]